MIRQIQQQIPSNRAGSGSPQRLPSTIANENGSVLVLALMLMSIMAVIGITSSETVVTENFIVRNAAIHKQNVNLVETALMEGLQRFMQIPDNNPNNFDPNSSNSDWINNRTAAWTTADWYSTADAQKRLDANNSLDANALATLATLADRGEAANGVLRYAVVGWEPSKIATGGSESLVVGGGAVWHDGRIIGEYVSADGGGASNGNGWLRMELGVKREW